MDDVKFESVKQVWINLIKKLTEEELVELILYMDASMSEKAPENPVIQEKLIQMIGNMIPKEVISIPKSPKTAVISVNRLMEEFVLSKAEAKQLKTILTKIPKSNYEEIDDLLTQAKSIIEGEGVESITAEDVYVNSYYRDIIALYINKGDSYDTTILYDTYMNRVEIVAWASWYEWWETQKKKRHG